LTPEFSGSLGSTGPLFRDSNRNDPTLFAATQEHHH